MVIGRFLELVPDEQVVHLVASDDSIFADENEDQRKMSWHFSAVQAEQV